MCSNNTRVEINEYFFIIEKKHFFKVIRGKNVLLVL